MWGYPKFCVKGKRGDRNKIMGRGGSMFIGCRLGYSVILKEMHGEGGDSAAVHCAVQASRIGNMGAPKES